MADDLVVRRARRQDADRIMRILEDGRALIARLGIEQWDGDYPDLKIVLEDIACGACYAAEADDGHLVGTLALRRDRDIDYARSDIAWLTCDDERAEPPYAAVHRCATAAEALRGGVMGRLVAEAESICRSEGRASLRADTHPGNTAMRSFLRRRGFTELAAFSLISHGSFAGSTRIGYEKLLERPRSVSQRCDE